MVAENLGSIPPNTSYMVAMVDEQRYNAYLASTEGSSAMIGMIKLVKSKITFSATVTIISIVSISPQCPVQLRITSIQFIFKTIDDQNIRLHPVISRSFPSSE